MLYAFKYDKCQNNKVKQAFPGKPLMIKYFDLLADKSLFHFLILFFLANDFLKAYMQPSQVYLIYVILAINLYGLTLSY